jgi:hypothetical protein
MIDLARDDLVTVERHVMTRYLELAHPAPESPFDITRFADVIDQQIPPEHQFPREQWVTHPKRRRIALITIDRALDLWEQLTEDQRNTVAFLLWHSGRERIA